MGIFYVVLLSILATTRANFIVSASILLILFAGVFIYWVYFCERYVVYAAGIYGGLLLWLSLLAGFPAYHSKTPDEELLVARSALAVLPGALAAIMATYFYCTKGQYFPYLLKDNKVSPFPQRGFEMSLLGYMVFGVAASIGKSLSKQQVSGAWVDYFFTCFGSSMTAWLVWVGQDSIRGLRILVRREKRTGVAYTFMLIDEIREARNRTYIVRLFKWCRGFWPGHSSQS